MSAMCFKNTPDKKGVCEGWGQGTRVWRMKQNGRRLIIVEVGFIIPGSSLKCV